MATRGVRVVSCDEKTGIQALERCAPTKPTRPGLVERREFEYKRHGTLCLIPSFDVATGQIITQSIGPTRTEEDFLAHLKKTVAFDPKAEWIFVCDQLNIHLSESLVRWVIDECNLSVTEEELGKKHQRGILRRVKTRKQFLEDPSHRIRFLYTP
ncbi:MAG: transposase, partial [Acidobacteriota bacterium]|nr:transposase [Acidobacteriota bacterium]